MLLSIYFGCVMINWIWNLALALALALILESELAFDLNLVVWNFLSRQVLIIILTPHTCQHDNLCP